MNESTEEEKSNNNQPLTEAVEACGGRQEER